MFEQNNIGARLTNPITTFIEGLPDEDSRVGDIRDQVECVYDMIDDEGTRIVLYITKEIFANFRCFILLTS